MCVRELRTNTEDCGVRFLEEVNYKLRDLDSVYLKKDYYGNQKIRETVRVTRNLIHGRNRYMVRD